MTLISKIISMAVDGMEFNLLKIDVKKIGLMSTGRRKVDGSLDYTY